MSVLITFIQKAIMQGICMLFGADGEILTEKSGNLNLGVPGMMYMGGIAGLMAAFYYEKLAAHPNGLVGMILSLLAAFLMAAFGGLIFSVLTITLEQPECCRACAHNIWCWILVTSLVVLFPHLPVVLADICSNYRRCLSC